MFTKKIERLEVLRKQQDNLHSVIDSEMMSIGVQIGMYHLELGVCEFADFVIQMLSYFGEAVKPYIKSLYEGCVIFLKWLISAKRWIRQNMSRSSTLTGCQINCPKSADIIQNTVLEIYKEDL